jgi:hypothetical protein
MRKLSSFVGFGAIVGWGEPLRLMQLKACRMADLIYLIADIASLA